MIIMITKIIHANQIAKHYTQQYFQPASGGYITEL